MHRQRLIGSADRFAGACAVLAVLACGKAAEAPAQPQAPIVSVLDLAISLRSKATAAPDSRSVEISAASLHVAGASVLTLTDGRIAEADSAGGQLPAFKAALAKAPHTQLTLAVGSSIPYTTVAAVLAAAESTGVQEVSFQVRPPGSSGATGLLQLARPSVRPKSTTDQPVAIAGSAERPWSDFTSKWGAIESACRASPSGNCASKPASIAEGGVLKLVLHAAGQAANIGFYRIGPPPEPKPEAAPPAKKTKARKKKQGAAPANVDPMAELEQAPPATEAQFQFRSQEAVSPSSAISETLRPVCGASACGVVVQAEKATLFVRVLALIGAAFPDGTAAPSVVFEVP